MNCIYFAGWLDHITIEDFNNNEVFLAKWILRSKKESEKGNKLLVFCVKENDKSVIEDMERFLQERYK